MYKKSDIDPKYKDNFIWYVWDIIVSVLNILETRMSNRKFQFLKKNVDNLSNLYKYEITKGNMNRRLIYVKYAVLLMKKDISVEKYENTPCFTNNICVKACANVNDLYRNLLKIPHVMKNYTLLTFLLLNYFSVQSQTSVDYVSSIELDALKEKLSTYSSDEFEGREAGKKGQIIAVEYLKEHYIKNNINSLLLIYTSKHPKVIQAYELEASLRHQLKHILDDVIERKVFELSNIKNFIELSNKDLENAKNEIREIDVTISTSKLIHPW